MSGKRNVWVCKGHELASALYNPRGGVRHFKKREPTGYQHDLPKIQICDVLTVAV